MIKSIYHSLTLNLNIGDYVSLLNEVGYIFYCSLSISFGAVSLSYSATSSC